MKSANADEIYAMHKLNRAVGTHKFCRKAKHHLAKPGIIPKVHHFGKAKPSFKKAPRRVLFYCIAPYSLKVYFMPSMVWVPVSI